MGSTASTTRSSEIVDRLETQVVITGRQVCETLLISRGALAALTRSGALEYIQLSPRRRRYTTASVKAILDSSPARVERQRAA